MCVYVYMIESWELYAMEVLCTLSTCTVHACVSNPFNELFSIFPSLLRSTLETRSFSHPSMRGSPYTLAISPSWIMPSAVRSTPTPRALVGRSVFSWSAKKIRTMS